MLWIWKPTVFTLAFPAARLNKYSTFLIFKFNIVVGWISSGHLMHDAAGNFFFLAVAAAAASHCVISFHKTLEMWKRWKEEEHDSPFANDGNFFTKTPS